MNTLQQFGKLLNESFDKIFVVNLDERTDRWETCLKTFEEYGITNYERFSAVKFDSIEDLDLVWWNKFRAITNPAAHKNWQRNMRTKINISRYLCGASGCKKSAHEVMEIIKERGYKRTLYLQDDFGIACQEITNGLLDTISRALKLKWDMLYLGGGGHWNWNIIEIDDGIFRIIDNFIDAHAFAVSDTMADKIIEELLISGMEDDRYYELIHKDINALCVRPFVFHQRETLSDITGNIPPKRYTQASDSGNLGAWQRSIDILLDDE